RKTSFLNHLACIHPSYVQRDFLLALTEYPIVVLSLWDIFLRARAKKHNDSSAHFVLSIRTNIQPKTTIAPLRAP
ncbi:MAG: hypothetical protein AAGC95_03925, partial [Pseudomonadota bacterium]